MAEDVDGDDCETSAINDFDFVYIRSGGGKVLRPREGEMPDEPGSVVCGKIGQGRPSEQGWRVGDPLWRRLVRR